MRELVKRCHHAGVRLIAALGHDHVGKLGGNVHVGLFQRAASDAAASAGPCNADDRSAGSQCGLEAVLSDAVQALRIGEVREDDVPALLRALEKFDEVFAVLADDDAPKIKGILDWARAEGREKEISPELLEIVGSATLSDAEIEKKVAEMNAARAARNFKESDRLRAELTTAGIIVENTKDGIRWRRK